MSTLIKFSDTIGIALLIIAGEYGTGTERKTAIEKLGYDYSTVQACVNELLPIINKYK